MGQGSLSTEEVLAVRRFRTESTRTKCVHPCPNLSKDNEIRLPLAIKLLEEGLLSFMKSAEVAGHSEKASAEILLQRGVSPLRYTDLDLAQSLRMPDRKKLN
jgi:predicted HTH domain antitoxin